MKRNVSVAAFIVVVVVVVYAFGVFFEFEYPYAYTLRRLRSARGSNGESIDGILKKHLGSSSVHWHSCSYCAGRTARRGLIYVEFRHGDKVYGFAYDRGREVLAPMSRITAEAFPELLPPNEPLVPVVDGRTGFVNGGEILIPRSWRART